jgi:hypothetical protein
MKKYTKEQICEIIELRKQGFNSKEISLKTKVNRRSVRYYIEKLSPSERIKVNKSYKERYIKYQINENGCHIYICKHLLKNRYPTKRVNGKKWVLSRYIYTKTNGTIPKGLVVRHKCDNPNCININHLELGTIADNTKDMVERNRSLKGVKHPRCKLNEQQVVEIFHSDESYKEISKKYDISFGAISGIKFKINWKHITKNL